MNKQKMIAWIVSGDTGTSSETIWAALMGVPYTSYDGRPADDIPKDTGDFGRCYWLVKKCSITKDELRKVVAISSGVTDFVTECINGLTPSVMKNGIFQKTL